MKKIDLHLHLTLRQIPKIGKMNLTSGKNMLPHLDALGLTYTQYIVLMVVWAQGTVSVRDLGKRLYLDSGTLTPVLKTLEKAGYISRRRSSEDERVLLVSVTDAGAFADVKRMEESIGQAFAQSPYLNPSK